MTPVDPSTPPAPTDEENARFFVRLIDVETKKVLDTLPDAMAPLAGSTHGRLLASVDADDKTRGIVWDTVDQKYLKLVGHTGTITGFAFGPKDDWLATSSEDGSTCLMVLLTHAFTSFLTISVTWALAMPSTMRHSFTAIGRFLRDYFRIADHTDGNSASARLEPCANVIVLSLKAQSG